MPGARLLARAASGMVLPWLALSSAATEERVPLATFVDDSVAGNAAELAAEATLRARAERRAEAYVVVGGLVTSTLLTLVLLPVMY